MANVILAAVYPMLVWFLVFQYRRQVRGFVIAIVGAGALLPLAWIAKAMMGLDSFSFLLIVYAESVLVLVVGLALATIRRAPTYAHCKYCFYDLTGLDVRAIESVCPECGEFVHNQGRRLSAGNWRPAPVVVEKGGRARIVDENGGAGADMNVSVLAAKKAVEQAKSQHSDGQDGDEQERKPGSL